MNEKLRNGLQVSCEFVELLACKNGPLCEDALPRSGPERPVYETFGLYVISMETQWPHLVGDQACRLSFFFFFQSYKRADRYLDPDSCCQSQRWD